MGDWSPFEKLVKLHFMRKGFQVTRRGGGNPDGGIDLELARGEAPRTAQSKRRKKQLMDIEEVRESLAADSWQPAVTSQPGSNASLGPQEPCKSATACAVQAIGLIHRSRGVPVGDLTRRRIVWWPLGVAAPTKLLEQNTGTN